MMLSLSDSMNQGQIGNYHEEIWPAWTQIARNDKRKELARRRKPLNENLCFQLIWDYVLEQYNLN